MKTLRLRIFWTSAFDIKHNRWWWSCRWRCFEVHMRRETIKLSMKSIPATVLEQFVIDFDSPHFCFVHDPLSNLDSFSFFHSPISLTRWSIFSPRRRWWWSRRSKGNGEDINLIQIHYIHYTFWPIRVLFNRSLLLLPLMFWRWPKQQQNPNECLRKPVDVIHHRVELFCCWWWPGKWEDKRRWSPLRLLPILPFHLISSLANVKNLSWSSFCVFNLFRCKRQKLFAMFVVVS